MTATHDRPAQLQRVLDELIAEGAAGVLAQFRDPTGTWSLTSGVAELGTCRSVDASGWFRIGSVTKTFTATVILQLAGESRLGLGDPLERWVPNTVPGGADITIGQLLSHTSGLYNYTRDLATDGILRDRHKRWTPSEVIAQAVRREPDFPPGTARAYNNTGYVLLGMVIEQVTRRSYREEIERRILRPLDLTRTQVGDGHERLPEPHAHGYLNVNGKPVDITAHHPSHAGAAGGMISTAADLNRFFAEVLAGTLLRPAERDAMQATVPTATPGIEGGLGLARYHLTGGVTVLGKDGGYHGYRTWSFHTPDASTQLTVSMTVALTSGPTTQELLTRTANAFGG